MDQLRPEDNTLPSPDPVYTACNLSSIEISHSDCCSCLLLIQVIPTRYARLPIGDDEAELIEVSRHDSVEMQR